MRENTRSVKVALKCLIEIVLVDVDLSYWTSKVEHIAAFTAIFTPKMGSNVNETPERHILARIRVV